MAIDLNLEAQIALLEDMRNKAAQLFKMYPPKAESNYVIEALNIAIEAATTQKQSKDDIETLVGSAEKLATNAMNFHNRYARIKGADDKGPESASDESSTTLGKI
jgi:hypothetical protein